MRLDRIQELLRLMESHGLEELEVEDKDFKVRLKKEARGGAPAAADPGAPPGTGTALAPAAEVAPEPSSGHHTITSPMVGTFYLASSPDGEPFVEVGDPVEVDTVICIVEAMKVMNEVKAEVRGTVEKILVENGRPVEYGQPLFFVAPS